MPTIILNRATTNPAIPKVPVYGFNDDFNRPDADTLGVTSGEGKPWVSFGSNTTAAFLGIRSNQLAPVQATAASALTYGVDAMKANGTLKAKINTPDGGTRLAMRIQDYTNFLALYVSPTSVSLRRYVNNVYADLGSIANQANAGKEFEIVMLGTSVSVKSNGLQIIGPVTVPEYATATFHGIQASTGSGTAARVDYLQFTPA